MGTMTFFYQISLIYYFGNSILEIDRLQSMDSVRFLEVFDEVSGDNCRNITGMHNIKLLNAFDERYIVPLALLFS